MRRQKDVKLMVEHVTQGKYAYCSLYDGWCFTKDNEYLIIVRNFFKSFCPSNITLYK